MPMLPTLPRLGAVLGECLGGDRAKSTPLLRPLQQAGLITMGASGRGGAQMTTRDCAVALIAMLGTSPATSVVDFVKRFQAISTPDGSKVDAVDLVDGLIAKAYNQIASGFQADDDASAGSLAGLTGENLLNAVKAIRPFAGTAVSASSLVFARLRIAFTDQQTYLGWEYAGFPVAQAGTQEWQIELMQGSAQLGMERSTSVSTVALRALALLLLGHDDPVTAANDLTQGELKIHGAAITSMQSAIFSIRGVTPNK